jgi:hypothetical protein
MKTREANFIHSADLHQAAMNVLGKVDGVSLARAMRAPKMRDALRAEQLRLATLKSTEAPTRGGG